MYSLGGLGGLRVSDPREQGLRKRVASGIVRVVGFRNHHGSM